ncbi:hypothetical protein [Flavobacterium sp.]|uniref:hypothetical protein n=1 Tax=Flavobacterium sp. TaxID=239 RepID=UPI003526E381
MNKFLVLAVITVLVSCTTKKEENKMETTFQEPQYTFMSISTAKEGKLDDLIRIASKPSELMDEKIEGLIARQVSVDRERNSVVVWVAFDSKETLYNYLKTDEGKNDHGDQEEMDAIIDTFVMYDLEPKSQRFAPKQ